MKKLLIIGLGFLVLIICSVWYFQISCYKQPVYKSIEAHREALKLYYQKSQEGKGWKRRKYERKFFEAFPTSYEDIGALYDRYDKHSPSLGCPTFQKHCGLFYKLVYPDQERYYQKYIELVLSGYPDNSKEFYNHLLTHIDPILRTLGQYTEEETTAFFRRSLEKKMNTYRMEHSENLHFYKRIYAAIVSSRPVAEELASIKTWLAAEIEFSKKGEVLTTYYKAAQQSSGDARRRYEQLFFEAFPNSFVEMQAIYGYDDVKGAAPLYGAEEHISFFCSLEGIDKELHYNKHIDICINGVFEGDAIREGFGIEVPLYKDTKKMVGLLTKRTEKEIKSVFRFIFDAPHPNNEVNDAAYKQLYGTIKAVHLKIALLLKEAYDHLLSEEHCHGH